MYIILLISKAVQVYWLDILIVILFLASLVILYKRGKKDTVKAIVLTLVVKAEQQLGSKTGKLKFNQVYSSLPWVVRLLFSQKQLYNLIEESVKELKKHLTIKGIKEVNKI